MPAPETQTTCAVSVIVPVYNGEAYLRQCLDSLLGQTLADMEVICVDDGSTDGTPDILAAYARADTRLRVLSEANAGPARARNLGMGQARGEFLYFFDADDFCDPELLEEAVRVGRTLRADLVALPFKLLNQQVGTPISVPWSLPRHLFPAGAFTWRANPDAAFSTFRTVPWNKLVRASFVREQGIRFQEDVRLSEDVMFSLPAVVLASSIACVERPLLTHREGAGRSAMDTKDAHPLDFLTAFCALRAFLEGRGVMSELRAAYVNWVVEGAAYNLFTLKTPDAFAAAFDRLHAGGLAELGISETDAPLLNDPLRAQTLSALASGDPAEALFCEQGSLHASFDLSAYRERVGAEQLETARRETDELAARVARLEGEARERDERVARLEGEIRERDERYAQLSDQFRRQMNAAEQKVGQVICYVPRVVQRWVLARRAPKPGEDGQEK